MGLRLTHLRGRLGTAGIPEQNSTVLRKGIEKGFHNPKQDLLASLQTGAYQGLAAGGKKPLDLTSLHERNTESLWGEAATQVTCPA